MPETEVNGHAPTSVPASPDSALAGAIDAAGRGFFVTRIGADGKTPIGKAWQTSATRDIAVITAEMAGAGNSNAYGIVTGMSGLLVVDEDTPGGFARYAQSVGKVIPATLTVATGRGRHFYFRCTPADTELNNSAGPLAAFGCDVRGNGGQVIGAGSMHRASGKRYRYETDVPPADVPRWLASALTSPVARNGHAPAEAVDPFALTGGIYDVPEVIRGPRKDGGGQRHVELLRYASSLRARSLPEVEALTLALALLPRCEQPPVCMSTFTADDVTTLVRDVYSRYPAGQGGAAQVGTADVEAAEDAEVTARRWPILKAAALQGVAGRIIELIEPTTEADPVAVLASVLAAVGCWLGVGPHLQVANSRHAALIWPLIVGGTSDGAKGTATAVALELVKAADPHFARIASGLSSGEGLIEAVRDPTGDDPDDKNFDEGETDKRLLIIESEFAAVLARMSRQGSTLGVTLRDAWDGKGLRVLNRKSAKLRADSHHIAVIAHVTPGELVARLDSADLAGGTINRYLPVLSRRSKSLPEGGNLPDCATAEVVALLHAARDAVKGRAAVDPYRRTPEAERWWATHYGALTTDRGDGRIGQATARAVPQVLRLGLTYALLDASPAIEVRHLKAARALWDYAEESARRIFGNAAQAEDGDQRSKLLEFISKSPAGVSREDIRSELFQGHVTSAGITRMLTALIESGRVEQRTEPTLGRPRQVFTSARKG